MAHNLSLRVNHPIPFGKYYLLDRINAGGMAEVFRAKAFGVEGFERVVAVKRILPNIAADTDFISMFVDEAKLAVQLNHANIAQIFDLGKVNDSYFIALEYVHGKDLRALFDDARRRRLRLPFALAAYVVMKTCEGLDYAHNRRDTSGRPLQLVHRDVSPQNVLVSFEGDVKLIDFGIAKAVGTASRTRAGVLKGKFGYLSPEQVCGEPVDRRSDIFTVGIVLHELLTGNRLFASDGEFSAIEKVRSIAIPEPAQVLPDIPPLLSAIAMRALARDKDHRFQTAMEMHDALQRFLHIGDESFTRRDLRAYMREHFPADAENDHEAVGDFGDESALSAITSDITPVAEPTESNAVIDETRDAPREGSAKPASTLLGMPVPARPSTGGRTMPPPPPRSSDPSRPVAARTAPPPRPRTVPPAPARPPRTVPPGQMTAVGTQPPLSRSGTQPPVSRGTQPPPLSRSGTQPPVSRGTQPPPLSRSGTQPPAAAKPRTVPPAPPRTLPPGAQGSMYSAPSLDASLTNPLLSMDWDDEELSTQVYDKPEDAYEAEASAPSTPAPGPSFYEGGTYGAPSTIQYDPQLPAYGDVPGDSGYGQPSQLAPSGGFNPNLSQPVGYGAAPGGYSANAYGYGAGQESQAPTYVPPPAGDQGAGYGVYATGPVPQAPSPAAYSAFNPPTYADLPSDAQGAQFTQAPSATARGGERSRSTLLYALAVGGVVMLCFFAYLFLAKTEPGVVQLTTHPTDATVLFDGRPVGSNSPFLITGVVPGDKHRLDVQKEGYRMWSQEVQVQPGQHLTFPVNLESTGEAPAPGGDSVGVVAGAVGAFVLESTPPGAKVFLDGQDLNALTPVRIGNLLPRTYSVRVVLDGYREQTVHAKVEPSVDTPLPRIVLQPSRVHVRVTSDPGGAEAAIVRGDERRDLGRTPVEVTLDNEGSAWTLEVQKSGYETFSQLVGLDGGQKDLNVRAVLPRLPGSSGHVPNDVASVEPARPVAAPRPAATNDVSDLVAAPARPAARPTPANDPASLLNPEPAGGPGTLRINSRPWSQVTIDGKSYGNTPQMNISLNAGSHKVTLVNPEFGIRKTITVQIKPGQTETQIVPLQ